MKEGSIINLNPESIKNIDNEIDQANKIDVEKIDIKHAQRAELMKEIEEIHDRIVARRVAGLASTGRLVVSSQPGNV